MIFIIIGSFVYMFFVDFCTKNRLTWFGLAIAFLGYFNKINAVPDEDGQFSEAGFMGDIFVTVIFLLSILLMDYISSEGIFNNNLTMVDAIKQHWVRLMILVIIIIVTSYLMTQSIATAIFLILIIMAAGLFSNDLPSTKNTPFYVKKYYYTSHHQGQSSDLTHIQHYWNLHH